MALQLRQIVERGRNATIRATAYASWAVRWLLYTPRPGLIAEHHSVAPEFPALTALSTLARFPWIWVCVNEIAWDIAGLPLVAVRTKRTGKPGRPTKRELVDDPVLDRVMRPNAGQDGVALIAQWVADEALTGNGYLWFPPGWEQLGGAIYRLHPFQTEAVVGFAGLPVAYKVTDRATGQTQIIPAEQVAHIRGLSWRDDERACLGESVIRCLNDDLLGDLGARQQGARLAKKGRPDMLFECEDGFGPKGEDEIRQRWEQAINGMYGAFAYGGKIKAHQLSWKPKDFGEKERDEVVRNKVCAAFGVPPSKACISTASYGASRQEMRVYWERQMARVQRIARALSKFARAGTAIEFDFSGVESLQVSYTERQMRVQTWVALGAEPRAAAEYEGFDDAPLPEGPLAELKPTMPIDRQPEEPQDDRETPARTARVVAAVQAHLVAGRLAYEAADESGMDTTGLPTFLGRQLEHALHEAGLETDAARWWGSEVAAISAEIVRSGGDPWAADRAQRVATLILTPRRAEVTA